MHKIFIDGASGTTGLEIRERLRGRAAFDLIALDDGVRRDVAKRREAIAAADIVILCLPDEAARDAVALAESASGTRFIDASSAHRTDLAWTYGFPELWQDHRSVIRTAHLVSNPGCYPTGFLALVAPLVQRGLIPADWPYVVSGVSGYSGGGKPLIRRYSDGAPPSYRAYALSLEHKHLGEMQGHAGLAHAPIFSPAVVPAYRGMLIDVPLPLHAMSGAAGAQDIAAALGAHYQDEPLVRVHHGGQPPDELVIPAAGPPSDRLDLHLFADADGSRMRLIAMLDNLGKGASGAAVQNLNLMTGEPETAGLLI